MYVARTVAECSTGKKGTGCICANLSQFADKFAVTDEERMGDVINLRRVRKSQQRAVAGATAAANRVVHGTPKQTRKLAKAEKRRAQQKTESHKLDPKR